MQRSTRTSRVLKLSNHLHCLILHKECTRWCPRQTTHNHNGSRVPTPTPPSPPVAAQASDITHCKNAIYASNSENNAALWHNTGGMWVNEGRGPSTNSRAAT